MHIHEQIGKNSVLISHLTKYKKGQNLERFLIHFTAHIIVLFRIKNQCYIFNNEGNQVE